MSAFSLRPMRSADQAFFFQVYASTRQDEMDLLDWPPEQKKAFLGMQFELRERQYRLEYPEAVREIILCNDNPAGAMITRETSDAIQLVDIALLPEFRQSGIGTTILCCLQKKGKRIVLNVLRENPAAHLYSRLGFVLVAKDSMYQKMEWNPQ